MGDPPHCRPRPSPSPLPAEHEGPVTSVCVSPGGLRVLSTTSSGHLGFLDVPSQEYHMLVRSHTAPVLALAIERSRGQLATVSQDRTVRVWDLATLQQVRCGQRGAGWEGGLEAAGHTEARRAGPGFCPGLGPEVQALWGDWLSGPRRLP